MAALWPGAAQEGAVKRSWWQSDAAVMLGLFVLGAAYLSCFRRFTRLDPDEGIFLQGAVRVAHGQLPYRDFFTFYTPGVFYLLAAVFRLFGRSFTVARWTLVVAGAGVNPASYALGRRVASRGTALWFALVVMGSALPFRFLVLPNWFATLLVLVAIAAAAAATGAVSRRAECVWAAAAGMLTGLTVLFEQSVGAGLLFGLLLGGTLLALRARREGRSTSSISAGLWFGLGWSLPLAATLAVLRLKHTLATALACWFWPLGHYSGANLVRLGDPDWTARSRTILWGGGWAHRLFSFWVVAPSLWLPWLAFLGPLLLFCGALRHANLSRGKGNRHAAETVICAAESGVLTGILLGRCDAVHFVYLEPLLLLPWVALWGSSRFRAIRRWLTLPLLSSYGAFAVALLLALGMGGTQTIATRRGRVVAAPGEEALLYQLRHLRRGGRLIVFPYLPFYNFLTATREPSRFDYLQPGMFTRQQFRAAAREWGRQPATPVLYQLNFFERLEESWPRSGAAAFDPVEAAPELLSGRRVCALLRSARGDRFLFLAPVGSGCPAELGAGQ